MKKNHFLTIIFLSAAFIVGLTGCDSNTSSPSYGYGNLNAMATVEKETGTVYPYFVLDNEKTLWVAEPLVPFDKLTPGQRIIGNFTILSGAKDGFDYFVRLNNYSKVWTKEVINYTQSNKDSIGNDPFTLNKLWVGADYLNAEFLSSLPSSKEHMVNLVNNRLTPPIDDGYAHLELYYNSLEPSPGPQIPGILSFLLGEYGPTKKIYKGLKVKVNTRQEGEKTFTFNYSRIQNDTVQIKTASVNKDK